MRDSDGTVIFSISDKLSGGSLLTSEFARQYDKPSLQLSPKSKSPAARLRTFIAENRIKVLKVAGSRASEEPEIARFVQKVLEEAFVR